MIFINFKLNLSKAVAFWVLFAVMFYREGELLLSYIAAIYHECAHLAATVCLGAKPLGMSIGVFGARLDIGYVISSRQRLLIYLSGPLASFFAFGILYISGCLFGICGHMYEFFIFINFVIGLINLLPIFPLDGSIALRSVFSKYLGVLRGARLCRAISVFFCGIIAGLNCLFFASSIFNPSSAVIFVFLLLGINKEKTYSLMEKKLVLSGEVYSGNKIRYIACDEKTDLLCLAGFISPDYSILAAAFKEERFFCELSQAEITNGIKKYGALCTIEEYAAKN